MIREWKEEMEEVRGIKGWREELRQMKEEVKERIKEQGKMMRGEIESVRREFKEREEKWREEREEMKRSLEGLERKLIEIEMREEKERASKGGLGDTGNGSVERRIREMERKIEMKEREEKRKNVIIREMEVSEGRRKEMAEEIIKRTEAKVSIEEVKRIGGDREKDREIMLVRLGSEEQRREVLMKKSNLRDRRERIMEDVEGEKNAMETGGDRRRA